MQGLRAGHRARPQVASFAAHQLAVRFDAHLETLQVAVDAAGEHAAVIPGKLPEDCNPFRRQVCGHSRAYYAPVPVPQFLLIDGSYADVQAFIAMVKRIGLVNTVRPFGTIAAAQAYLAAASESTLPVVVFSGGTVDDGDGPDLFAWLEAQDLPLGVIPTVTLEKPLEMYAVIAALKALALPERTRIDTTTLTVRVELWPHGTSLNDT